MKLEEFNIPEVSKITMIEGCRFTVMFLSLISFQACTSAKPTFDQKIIDRELNKIDFEKLNASRENSISAVSIRVFSSIHNQLKRDVEPWYFEYYLCEIDERSSDYKVVCRIPYKNEKDLGYQREVLGSNQIDYYVSKSTFKIQGTTKLE